MLVALVDRLDRKLHDPDDLEKLTGSPLLVHIPPSAFPGSPPDPGVPLAFQMLRDSLVYFNVDRPLDSLIVVSSLKGEGKTTVAANLAIAYARTGKRIIAMDADLRSPELALRLGLESTPGLSTVLAGDATLEEAVPSRRAVRRQPARAARRTAAAQPVGAPRLGEDGAALR